MVYDSTDRFKFGPNTNELNGEKVMKQFFEKWVYTFFNAYLFVVISAVMFVFAAGSLWTFDPQDPSWWHQSTQHMAYHNIFEGAGSYCSALL